MTNFQMVVVLCKIGRMISFFKFQKLIENYIFESHQKKLVELMSITEKSRRHEGKQWRLLRPVYTWTFPFTKAIKANKGQNSVQLKSAPPPDLWAKNPWGADFWNSRGWSTDGWTVFTLAPPGCCLTLKYLLRESSDSSNKILPVIGTLCEDF